MPKAPKKISMRHSWGEPNRLQFKTERQCLKCPIVKVTHHQSEGPFERHWTEFWHAETLEMVAGADAPTPKCEPVQTDVAQREAA